MPTSPSSAPPQAAFFLDRKQRRCLHVYFMPALLTLHAGSIPDLSQSIPRKILSIYFILGVILVSQIRLMRKEFHLCYFCLRASPVLGSVDNIGAVLNRDDKHTGRCIISASRMEIIDGNCRQADKQALTLEISFGSNDKDCCKRMNELI